MRRRLEAADAGSDPRNPSDGGERPPGGAFLFDDYLAALSRKDSATAADDDPGTDLLERDED